MSLYTIYGLALTTEQTLTLLGNHFPSVIEEMDLREMDLDSSPFATALFSGGCQLPNGLRVIAMNHLQTYLDIVAVVGVFVSETSMSDTNHFGTNVSYQQFRQTLDEMIVGQEEPIYHQIFSPGYQAEMFNVLDNCACHY